MTAPAIPAPAPKGLLGNGQLRRQVAEWLAVRPGPHTIGEIAKDLGRSASAVGNALTTLADRAEAARLTGRPVRYEANSATAAAAAAITPRPPPRPRPRPRPGRPPPSPAGPPRQPAGRAEGSRPDGRARPMSRPGGRVYRPRVLAGMADVEALRTLRASDRGTGINAREKKKALSAGKSRHPPLKIRMRSGCRPGNRLPGRWCLLSCQVRTERRSISVPTGPGGKRHLELSRSRLTSCPDQSNCRPENTGAVKSKTGIVPRIETESPSWHARRTPAPHAARSAADAAATPAPACCPGGGRQPGSGRPGRAVGRTCRGGRRGHCRLRRVQHRRRPAGPAGAREGRHRHAGQGQPARRRRHLEARCRAGSPGRRGPTRRGPWRGQHRRPRAARR